MFKTALAHAGQAIDKGLDRVPVPAQAAANVATVAAVEATSLDWLRILTIALIAVQIIYWLSKLVRIWFGADKEES